MALRNYMYYKHQDSLKEKIAHGVTQQVSSQNVKELIPATSDDSKKSQEANFGELTKGVTNLLITKKKRLTPTQLRKLERQKQEMNNS
jgi:hypothetical protein